MTGQTREEKPARDIRGSVWPRKRVLCLLWLILSVATGVRGWEEGDDTVNVISVENMDALLGLRMVTELKAFEGIETNETEPRLKRMVEIKQKPLSGLSQVSVLCSRNDCRCNNVGNGYLNVSCEFTAQGTIDITSGSVPPNACEIHLTNSAGLRVAQGAFSSHPHLVLVAFRHVDTLTISSSAFQNLSNSSLYLEIKDCSNVTLEENSFRNFHSDTRVRIENCKEVMLKKSIFSWLLAFEILNVPKLELVENTFSVEVKRNPETVILFQNVTINDIPNGTFPLSAAEIRFVDSDIRTISTGAFNAVVLLNVYFERTKLGRWQNGAFSERTLIQYVEFKGVNVGHVDSNALSAAAKFTMQNCRIQEVTSGAFNVSTAYLKLLGNHFRKIRRYAFQIQNWNSIIIEGNRFDRLEPDSISAPFSNVTRVRNEFSFSNNTLFGVEVNVLAFVPNEPGLEATVRSNVFEEVCHCHLESWIRERTGPKWESFYETSYCVISSLLEKCYNITEGYMNMKEYMEEFCTPANIIVCEDVSKTHRPNVLIPIDLQNTERTVLGVIFLGVVCSIGIMLIILSLMWMKEKGLCGSSRKSAASTNSGFFSLCLCNNGNLVTTNSISRINIHEYAEIQNQLNQQQKQTILAVEEETSDNEEVIACENKATQTLPEELTQELLQSLREKLDDPENYTEARDMIEHLYDLIKVEESCNNNNVTPRTSFLFDDDDDEDPGGIYEIIQKSPYSKNTKTRRKGVDVVSTGTRAPSPDKLSPISFNLRRPPVVSDYIEPRDRKSNEYCELPSANLIMPDVLTSSQIKNNVAKTHIYAEPLHLSQRPLPQKPDQQPGTSDS